jgi:hypothetical protein
LGDVSIATCTLRSYLTFQVGLDSLALACPVFIYVILVSAIFVDGWLSKVRSEN